MNNYTLFIVMLIILLLSCFFPVYGSPGHFQVREELQTLLKELHITGKADYNPDNRVIEFLIKILNKIISVIIRFGSILAIPIVILLVFLVSYIGLKFFSRFRRERDKAEQSYTRDEDIHGMVTAGTLADYVQKAEGLAKKGEYGDALVLLHKASIVFLQLKKIILAGEYYTNNEIRKILLDNKRFYEPFSSLARAAELKTFRYEKIPGKIYEELLKEYKNNFMLN